MKQTKIPHIYGIVLIIVGLILTYQSILNPLNINITNLQLIALFFGVVIIFISKKALPGLLILYIDLALIYSNNNSKTLMDVLIDFWPFLLILLGVSFLLDSLFHKLKRKIDYNDNKYVKKIYAKDYFEETIVLNYKKLIIDASPLVGGKISAFMGGMEIYLENLDLAKPIKFDVQIFFSGLKIHIPANVKINLEITPVFGGVADKRTRVSSLNQKPNILTIKGITAFGGIEIIN